MFSQGQFLIDPNTSPDEIIRKRAALNKVMRAYGRANNLGEGIGDLAMGIGQGIQNYRVGKAERAQSEGANSAFESLLGGGDPAAPTIDAGGFPSAPAPTDDLAQVPTQAPVQSSVPFDGSLKSGIASTAESLGIDPIDLATAISYETAGTFDPTKKGPTTQWGQHRGLIQFGEPQAQKYGVNWDDPVGSQLGPEGAVAKYLRDTGVKPGMGMLDIYSAINAGGVGRYNRSDANNGGAPGTVADKVKNQMAGHRAKALAMFGGGAQSGAAQAVNTMGGQPIPQGQTPIDGYQSVTPTMQNVNRMMVPSGPQPMAQGRDALAQALMQQQAGTAAPQAIEQIMAQANPAAAKVQQAMQGQSQGTNLDMNKAIELMNNPFLDPGKKQVLGAMLERQMQAQDPVRQMQLEKGKLELEQMRNPKPDLINAGNGRLYDPASQQWITAPDSGREGFRKASSEEAAQYGAPGGQFGPDGRFYPINPPSGTALSVDPTTGAVTFQQGAGVKPLTEGQSKDTVYATRAAGALPVLDEFGGALTSAGQRAMDMDPTGIVRGQQSPEFQQARQAGDEFLQAILRKDTGAAITTDEMQSYGRTYLPSPGDGPEVLAQKKVARARALEAMKAGMPPQAILQQEKALAASGQEPSANKPISEMTDEELEALANGN